MITHAIILAAGKGTRMKSEKPKVLHKVRGVVLIDRVLKSLSKVSSRPTIIIGHKGEEIIRHTKNKYHYVWQKEQLGTGHAVLCARESLMNAGRCEPSLAHLEARAPNYPPETPPSPPLGKGGSLEPSPNPLRGRGLKSPQPPFAKGGEIENPPNPPCQGGDAVAPLTRGVGGLDGKIDNIIVVYGDHPFISPDTIEKLEKSHIEKKAKITMSTVIVPNFGNIRQAGVSPQRTPAQKRANQDYFTPAPQSPRGDCGGALDVPAPQSCIGDSDGALVSASESPRGDCGGALNSVFYGYGRVVRGENGNIKGIVELKDTRDEEKNIKELNVGYYCFDADFLWENIGKIKNDNNAKEYNLTDIVKIAIEQGIFINSISIENPLGAMGVNSLEQLEAAEKGFWG